MPCYCGATDCPSCGPAQGYQVHRIRNNRGYVWVNPENEDEGIIEEEKENEE